MSSPKVFSSRYDTFRKRALVGLADNSATDKAMSHRVGTGPGGIRTLGRG